MSQAHAADLELARRCAAGDAAAWDRFVLEFRPVLYRAADALDPRGGAREIADSLYAELYGIKEASGERQSLFRYFHGRSSLATWLRAVLAQRYVDRLRANRRLEALPDERVDTGDNAGAAVRAAQTIEPDPERPLYIALVRSALAHAVGRLPSRDRLRLACYYVQGLTLAELGRITNEHEATVSRQLARTRRVLRNDVEAELRKDAGLTEAQIAECFASVAGDPGPLDLTRLFDRADRADGAGERSL
jgi:RNA polymerase sigma factor (sigma-70 family)